MKTAQCAQVLPTLRCRKCDRQNPVVYFAPVSIPDKHTDTYTGTCICYSCADERGWIDKSGDIKAGVSL